MVIAVLTIGVLNLALGFALAILLERPVAVSWLRMHHAPRRRRRTNRAVETSKNQQEVPSESAFVSEAVPVSDVPQPVSAAEPPAETSVSTAPVWDGLPSPWVARLRSDKIAPRSFAEGALWFIHRNVPECRNRLTSIMDRIIDSPSGPLTSDEIQQPANNWLDQTSQWVSTIKSARTNGPDSAVCDELGQVLEEQLIKIRPAVTKCQQISLSDETIDRRAIMQPFFDLVQTTNAVRDQVQEILGRMLQQEKRLQDIPAEFHFDEKTQLYNRLGLAKIGDEWIRNDPARVRLVCGVLVDVDRFSEINKTLGLTVADSLLESLGRLINSLIRKERGFDRIARIGGQRFFLFFGDTALRNAMYGAERIRMNVQATSFKAAEATIRLTVSCAVCEWTDKQSLDEWLYGIQLLLVEAKDSGRNCTFVEEANGPRVIAPSNKTVAPREIVVGEQ